jgi:pimeloyl-ACP methyl ester carboxylesterase
MVDLTAAELAKLNARFDAFCQPGGRDTSPKALRLLDDAERLTLKHTQVPSGALGDHPPIDLAVYRWRAASEVRNGRSALLVHGWEMSAGRMAAFAGPLLAAGCDVLAADMPAHGQSGGIATTMVDWSSAITQIVNRFAVNALIGHSFGGMSACWALAHAHSRPAPAGSVDRLVLLASGSSIAFLLDASQATQDLDAAGRLAFEQIFAERVGSPLSNYDTAQAAAQIQAPILTVHDPRDPLVPFAHAERYVQYSSNARLRPAPGLGHLSLLRDADVVTEVTAFARSAHA